MKAATASASRSAWSVNVPSSGAGPSVASEKGTKGFWLTGASPVLALNAQMYAERTALRQARATMDDDIIALLAAMSDADMAGDVTYKTTDGDPFTMARSVILQHFFNHQTHHRGQAHDLLSQTGVAPPVLDLLYFVRE